MVGNRTGTVKLTRVCDVAVGDVLENYLARIKGFLSVLDVFLWLGHAHDGVVSRDAAAAANRRWG